MQHGEGKEAGGGAPHKGECASGRCLVLFWQLTTPRVHITCSFKTTENEFCNVAKQRNDTAGSCATSVIIKGTKVCVGGRAR